MFVYYDIPERPRVHSLAADSDKENRDPYDVYSSSKLGSQVGQGYRAQGPRKSAMCNFGRDIKGSEQRVTNVGVEHRGVLKTIYPRIKLNEVAIYYANGRHMAIMDKEAMCRQSQYFSRAFHGSFKESSTRCMRLCGDSPFAIAAMTRFISNGYYSLMDIYHLRNPYMTILDLHVHAYIAADKYLVHSLCRYAIHQYLSIALRILSFHVSCSLSDPARPLNAPRNPLDQSPEAEMDGLFDSMVLLWRNTRCGRDMMRRAVVSMIVTVLPKLMHFKMFARMVEKLEDFAFDLGCKLWRDGLECQFVVLPEGAPKVGFFAVGVERRNAADGMGHGRL